MWPVLLRTGHQYDTHQDINQIHRYHETLKSVPTIGDSTAICIARPNQSAIWSMGCVQLRASEQNRRCHQHSFHQRNRRRSHRASQSYSPKRNALRKWVISGSRFWQGSEFITFFGLARYVQPAASRSEAVYHWTSSTLLLALPSRYLLQNLLSLSALLEAMTPLRRILP